MHLLVALFWEAATGQISMAPQTSSSDELGVEWGWDRRFGQVGIKGG